MAAPYNNIRSKLNRAIAAYLVSAGAGRAADVLLANTSQPKGFPNTTIRSAIAKPEVQFVSLYMVTVHIVIRESAVSSNRVAFDQRISATFDAMMQSDDGQSLKATAALITAAGRALATTDPENNADMADFTCQAVHEGGCGDGEPDKDGTYWEEILIFDCLCSPSNVD